MHTRWKRLIVLLALFSTAAITAQGTDLNETKENFSPLGQKVIESIQKDWGHLQGVEWNVSADSKIDLASFILQTPPASYHGLPTSALDANAPTGCAGQPDCDPDFDLKYCEDSCEIGTCVALASSVKAPGQEAKKMCVGHSYQAYERIYGAIIKTEKYLDLQSLSNPDGRFLAAIRNAVTYLSHTGRAAQIRMLFGTSNALAVWPEELIEQMTRDIAGNSKLSINIGVYGSPRGVQTSWNHSKIIAVDDQNLLQGGHNLWNADYLALAPIADITMEISGTPVVDAHNIANRQWEIICNASPWKVYTNKARYPSSAAKCPPAYSAPVAPELSLLEMGTELLNSVVSFFTEEDKEENVPVISVGRLGWAALHAFGDYEDPSDTAILALLNNAEDNLKISVQDIGGLAPPIPAWPKPIIESFGNAVLRGVDVELVQSSPCSFPGGKTWKDGWYGNGWKPESIGNRVIDFLVDEKDMDKSEAKALVCEKMALTELRYNQTENKWSNGASMGNHAKFFIADDQTFYLGSQNLYAAFVGQIYYPTPLAQFGLIVDSEKVTTAVKEQYWNKIWQSSKRTAVSGPGVDCQLGKSERDFYYCELP